MPKKVAINPRKGAILSPAVRCGDLVFISGVIGIDADGKPAPDILSQSRLCMEKMKSVLEEAGTSLSNVVKVLGFVTDLKDRTAFNDIYVRYFEEDAPARSCVAVSDLGEGILLEVECIACMPE